MEEKASKDDSKPKWRVPLWFSDLPRPALEKLSLFHVELLRFNAAINLISSGTVTRADQIHFSDCILATQKMFLNTQATEIFDIGCGNGFPGVVMAILDENRHFTLIDSDSRKMEFIRSLVQSLALKNVRIHVGRYEEIARGAIHTAIMRGLTNIPKSLVALRHQFQVGGELYHMKGSEWAMEIASIPTQVCSTWNTEPVGEYDLPDSDEKRILIVSKRIQV